LDPDGNIYVCNFGYHCIQKLLIKEGKVEVVAGIYNKIGAKDGAIKEATFHGPSAMVWDYDGNLIVSDTRNHRIRKINLRRKEVTTIIGSGMKGFKDGFALQTKFDLPTGIAIDKDGNIYICDYNNHRIRKYNPFSGKVLTIAGSGDSKVTDGIGLEAQLSNPLSCLIDQRGNLIIAEFGGHSIRRILRVVKKRDRLNDDLYRFAKNKVININLKNAIPHNSLAPCSFNLHNGTSFGIHYPILSIRCKALFALAELDPLLKLKKEWAAVKIQSFYKRKRPGLKYKK